MSRASGHGDTSPTKSAWTGRIRCRRAVLRCESLTVNPKRCVTTLAAEDHGPGIAPEDLPHIFEPSYRSARALQRGVVGVGLGLAVVRRIATACGGCASVHSEPGAGACFEIHFPLVPAPAQPDDAPAEIDQCPVIGVESKG
jgi:signal transduction histidine kinase